MHRLKLTALLALSLAACGGASKVTTCRPPECTSASSSYAVEVVGSGTSALPQTELTGVTLDNTTGFLALSLGQNVQITGRVTFDNKPVAASVVLTRPSLIPGRADVFYEATSDPTSGLYAVTLPPSTANAPYMVRIRPTDNAMYPPYTTTLSLTQSGTHDVDLAQDGAILHFTGSLANAVSIGIVAAKVVLRDAKTLDDLSTTSVTSSDGMFSVALASTAAGGADGIVLVVQQGDVATGQLTLTVPIDAALLSPSADAMHLSLPALPATTHLSIPVVGTSSSGTMEPVIGATFRLTATLTDTSSTGTVVHEIDGQTDAHGKIEADLYGANDGARTYSVVIVPPTGKDFETPPAPFTVNVGASSGVTQQLSLSLRPLLTGRVLDASGQPLAGASLQAQVASIIAATSLSTPSSFTTGPDGRFGLRVDRETYDVGISPPAAAKLPRRWLDRTIVNADRELGDLQLPSAVMFDVVLRDAMQMPVQATVRLFVVPGSDPDCASTTGCVAVPQLEAEVATGSDGSATMLLPAQAMPDMGSAD